MRYPLLTWEFEIGWYNNIGTITHKDITIVKCITRQTKSMLFMGEGTNAILDGKMKNTAENV